MSLTLTIIPKNAFDPFSFSKPASKDFFKENHITTIPDIIFHYISLNKASIKDFFKENEMKANDRIREICFLKMIKNTNSIELENKAEDLSNLMFAQLASLAVCGMNLKSACRQNGVNNKEDKLDTQFFTELINTELDNIRKDCLDKYFPGNNIPFNNFKPEELSANPKMTYAEYYTLLIKLHDLVIEKAANYADCHIVDPDFKLQYRDLKTQEIRTLTSTNEINCMRYAFYQAHEKKLAPWIFQENSRNPFISVDGDVIVQKMMDLGYTLATQAQRGDLIVYMDKSHQFTHIGWMFDAKTVLSKWGSLQVVSHPIKSVPKNYRNYFMLFRKERADPCTEWTLDSSRFQDWHK